MSGLYEEVMCLIFCGRHGGLAPGAALGHKHRWLSARSGHTTNFMVVVEMAPWQPDCRSALVDRLSPHKEGNAEEAVVSIIRGQCQKKQVFRSWQGGQD